MGVYGAVEGVGEGEIPAKLIKMREELEKLTTEELQLARENTADSNLPQSFKDASEDVREFAELLDVTKYRHNTLVYRETRGDFSLEGGPAKINWEDECKAAFKMKREEQMDSEVSSMDTSSTTSNSDVVSDVNSNSDAVSDAMDTGSTTSPEQSSSSSEEPEPLLEEEIRPADEPDDSELLELDENERIVSQV